MAKKVVQTKKKKKVKKSVSKGAVHIKATFNNTIISITEDNGNVLAASSSGACGFKGSRKSTPYAAQIAMESAVEKAKPYGLSEVDVYIKGVGSGRETAVRALQNLGIYVKSIKDVTPLPHNGCRAKKPRRV
ncbi:30S ribosomal protein S11 [candidate division WS5 bacterium]|uniref:Small ribosomal subunit protein uS11 n=1 Tax=candidate division WS5 bacterium TaxID=2093353 RepID=A0A419DAB9_9BACT|nr:MAG: 30S ribosomal protein S11 [candidate division WS5 bacterium]